MSTTVGIICDGCGEATGQVFHTKSLSSPTYHHHLRAALRLNGWVQIGSLDYCQRCAEARRNSDHSEFGGI